MAENEINESVKAQEEEKQIISGDYAKETLGILVIDVDEVRVDLPIPVTHGQIVDALVAKGPKEGYDAEHWALKAQMVADVTLTGSYDELAYAKAQKLIDITEYDSSDNVNDFIFGGKHMWLDNAMRDKLAKRLDVDRRSGLTTTKIVYEYVSYELPIEQAEQMLLVLEQYARDAFDKTNEHKAAVNALKSVAKVKTYDYTVGYPEKINFDEMFSE